jgi:hypothetical protein
MPTIYQLQAQIKAITEKVIQGKAKNKFAAINKISSLKKQLTQIQKETNLQNYLSI